MLYILQFYFHPAQVTVTANGHCRGFKEYNFEMKPHDNMDYAFWRDASTAVVWCNYNGCHKQWAAFEKEKGGIMLDVIQHKHLYGKLQKVLCSSTKITIEASGCKYYASHTIVVYSFCGNLSDFYKHVAGPRVNLTDIETIKYSFNDYQLMCKSGCKTNYGINLLVSNRTAYFNKDYTLF